MGRLNNAVQLPRRMRDADAPSGPHPPTRAAASASTPRLMLTDNQCVSPAADWIYKPATSLGNIVGRTL